MRVFVSHAEHLFEPFRTGEMQHFRPLVLPWRGQAFSVVTFEDQCHPELKWPGHNADFAGPGSPDELAQAALEFLRKNPNWSKPEYDDEHIPVAACVTAKGWEVSKTAPLTKQTTQYSLDIFVAFKGKKNPKIAYCCNMVFYTAEEAGVNMGLPFRYANSRQYAKYRMLMSHVPVK